MNYEKALIEKLSFRRNRKNFYHLIQRRGILSNSRKAGSDDGTFLKGIQKGKIGITETQKKY